MADIIKKEVVKKDYIASVGRRKEAVARLRLYTGTKDIEWDTQVVKKGEIFVNKKPIDQYFNKRLHEALYLEPFRITNTLHKYAITVIVSGGGLIGQLDAFVHAVSRALNALDKEKFRPILKKKKFLTRDSRTRERRKVGMGGKARRKRQSPKR